VPETLTRVVLAARPAGAPTSDCFRVETAPLPQPGPGEFLARTLWLSLDPYMRGRMDDAASYAAPVAVGAPMEGEVVAEVVASRHPGFATGEIVAARLGWVSHAVSDGAGARKVDPAFGPVSTALGVLGMPGHTAWVGLGEIGGAKPGETILVSAATGAVGSLVCQLAKRRGLRVIGVAGGAEKCAWAVSALGCDACLDHRAAPDAAALAARLAAAAPEGVDLYWENVGGPTLAAALSALKTHGRIVVCGMIAWYSGAGAGEAPPLARAWRTILTKRLTVRGFIVFDHAASFPAFLAEVGPLVRDGALVWRETVAEGLAAAPAAFLDLLAGRNLGKQLVRVGADA
jgi:NADPH-dependent curcumin reductase CurA